MFCPENRLDREIFWAGFGFQVWCQMLTFIVQSREKSLLIIDEPDIYLHADLQRQLVSILRHAGPDILIASHSTEIVTEVEPDEIVTVDKSKRSASRVHSSDGVQKVFTELGSSLNPTLTQLAKTRRVVFVEGNDFKILARFASLMGLVEVANQSGFAVVSVRGFNPDRVNSFREGMEKTLGSSILSGVIFDRDYRSPEEAEEVSRKLEEFSVFGHIHERKEIENYLLVPAVLDRAIHRRVADMSNRSGREIDVQESADEILSSVTVPLETSVLSQLLAKRESFERQNRPGSDPSTIHRPIIDEFNATWSCRLRRLRIAPGKEVLSSFRTHLQDRYGFTVTASGILSSFRRSDLPADIAELMCKLDRFRQLEPQSMD